MAKGSGKSMKGMKGKGSKKVGPQRTLFTDRVFSGKR